MMKYVLRFAFARACHRIRICEIIYSYAPKSEPTIFGVRSGTEIAKCLDLARKGHFVHVPNSYPEGAWFTYDDKSCEYGCMITEYIYWAMTSMLGAQKSIHRQREITHEWRLPTRELVRKGDPDVYKLLIDPRYKFPKKLPDGKYKLKISD